MISNATDAATIDVMLFGLSFVVRLFNNKKENGFSMGLVFISLVLVVIGISL